MSAARIAWIRSPHNLHFRCRRRLTHRVLRLPSFHPGSLCSGSGRSQAFSCVTAPLPSLRIAFRAPSRPECEHQENAQYLPSSMRRAAAPAPD